MKRIAVVDKSTETQVGAFTLFLQYLYDKINLYFIFLAEFNFLIEGAGYGFIRCRYSGIPVTQFQC